MNEPLKVGDVVQWYDSTEYCDLHLIEHITTDGRIVLASNVVNGCPFSVHESFLKVG